VPKVEPDGRLGHAILLGVDDNLVVLDLFVRDGWGGGGDDFDVAVIKLVKGGDVFGWEAAFWDSRFGLEEGKDEEQARGFQSAFVQSNLIGKRASE
jgi:hypothetical protein